MDSRGVDRDIVLANGNIADLVNFGPGRCFRMSALSTAGSVRSPYVFVVNESSQAIVLAIHDFFYGVVSQLCCLLRSATRSSESLWRHCWRQRMLLVGRWLSMRDSERVRGRGLPLVAGLTFAATEV